MEFIHGLANLRRQRKECATTIGNFDGIHLGHQRVLEQLVKITKHSNLISTVLIFEPQPMEYFNLDIAPSRLTRLREKLQQFSRYNIDRVICLKFNKKLANFSASEFVDNILLGDLGARKIIVGNDFRFAKNREGDYQYLSKISTQKNFEVFMTDPYIIDGERVSSTLIRDALAKGEITTANRYLGRPYTISGRVVHGDKRGKKIGFPTINIELHRYWSPIAGIFSGYIHGVDNRVLDAVIYIGSKPVYQGKRVVLEAHILDFNSELYGHYIQVELISKLRDDEHITSEKELIKQIKRDINETRLCLKKIEVTNK